MIRASDFRYPADTWCVWFCKGYLLVDRICKLIGQDLDD